jgi:hypothetical protein
VVQGKPWRVENSGVDGLPGVEHLVFCSESRARPGMCSRVRAGALRMQRMPVAA